MISLLVSWIGDHDFNYTDSTSLHTGPVVALLDQKADEFDEVHLFYDDHNIEASVRFCEKINSEFGSKVICSNKKLKNPTDYHEIYTVVTASLEAIQKAHANETIRWSFHTSPGTSQMAAIWLLLSKTEYPAELYQAWIDKETYTSKVRKTEFSVMPKVILREMMNDDHNFEHCLLLEPEPENSILNSVVEKSLSEELLEQWRNLDEYTAIIHESESMKKILHRVHRMAPYAIPVLLYGESGTGKEMIAKLLHKGSQRMGKFVVLNCAAMTESLAESKLFGWSKGAWTDAKEEGKGIIRSADEGTLFLDEIADLSLDIQTKMLRAIQFGEVRRVGDNETFRCDVRFIAATNKDLMAMVRNKTFREDLFYRLCVGYVHVPPLRERENDAALLARHFLREINITFSRVEASCYTHKELSREAEEFIVQHSWKGNIRELEHTLGRACLWSSNDVLTADDIEEALLDPFNGTQNITPHYTFPMDIEEHLDRIRKEVIEKALADCGGAITKAAEMLGYNNYQTLSEHMKKLGIEKK